MDLDFTDLVDGLRAGDDAAVRQFCGRYGPALERLAQRNMAAGLQVRVGSEDVVQSVYRTFFRRAADGQFSFEGSRDLWRLLCAITLTKVREKARFHNRQRRGFQQDVALADGPDLSAEQTAPDEQAAFVQLFEQVLADLDDEERQIVDLRLQGRTHGEVADALKCSERTVRRILARMKQRFAVMTPEA